MIPNAERHRFGSGKKVRTPSEMCRKGKQLLEALAAAQRTTTDNTSSFNQSLEQFDKQFRLTSNTKPIRYCIANKDTHTVHNGADEHGCDDSVAFEWLEAKEITGSSKYSNAINSTGKCLVAIDNEGKGPGAMHWDRAVAACLAKQNPPMCISDIRRIIQRAIATDEWVAAVDWLYKACGVKDPGEWITVRKSDKEEYFTLLGTPNGVGTVHMLMDHVKYKVGAGRKGFGIRASIDHIRVNRQMCRMDMSINVPQS